MANLEIVHYPDEILLKVGKPVADEEFDDELQTLVDDMFKTMYENMGVGLAAPQVGFSRRVFVMDCGGEENPRQFAVINPEIVAVEGTQVDEEGCLSFPGIISKVQRELNAHVRFRTPDGSYEEQSFTGLEARCFLHEADHCDGIVFLDRMSPLKRELAKRKIRKLRRTGEWA